MRHQGVRRQAALAAAVALLASGVGMLGLSPMTAISPVRLAGELLAGAAVVASGVLIAAAWRQRGRRVTVGLLPGELALDSVLVYLALALSAPHHGSGARAWVLLQFVVVLLGLVAGAAGLSLFRPRSGPRGPVFAVVVRDGVLLVVGTLLVAIAVGESSSSSLSLPRWNWISFLGLTIPGMLVLLGRERVKRSGFQQPNGARSGHALAIVLTEVLLVAGLAVMVFGSTANLTLGRDGFVAGLAGNGPGLALWAASAALLVAAGALWRARTSGAGSRPRAIAAGLLYVPAVMAFVAGERAVQLGRDPSLSVSGSLAFAVVVLLAGALVLAGLRPLAMTTTVPARA